MGYNFSMQTMTEKIRRLCSGAELDLRKTFECGQCFRWREVSPGRWFGVASGRAAELYEQAGEVYISCGEEDLGFWRGYFDLDRDYGALKLTSPYLRDCAEFGAGIRILRQDAWEALCSFIISQCNNIRRITSIVERLCAQFGREAVNVNGVYRIFPEPEILAALEPEDLAELRCGYRAPYIISAARAVDGGALDLERLSTLSHSKVLHELIELPGVGPKVANCVILYGLGNMSGFPVDVWMRRALKEHFPTDFDPASLGELAGLAQQYMFYYERSKSKESRAGALPAAT